MKWLGFSLVPRARTWVKKQRRDVKDGVVLFGLALIAYLIAHFEDAPQKLFQFALDYQDWDIDDLIFVSVVLSIAWMAYGFRRYRDFSIEIKARREAELEAHKLAQHDPLTGLPNRRFFAEKLDVCLRNATAAQRVALLMLDLDGFKKVNDTHGHAVGDEALREFAQRVCALLRPDTVLARMGGDEFAIVMAKIKTLEDPTNLARRIAATVVEPFTVDGATVEFGVGAGIAIAPDDGTEPDELLRRADRALYRAKEAGRSSVRFFEPEMDTYIQRRIDIERELRSAIASNLVVPNYQPLVSLNGGSIIGFEALARWKSNALGQIPPDVFIPIAEENGLMNVLSDQLFLRACLDASTWPANLFLAFNISPVQLCDATLGLRMLSILGQTGFSPRRLEIEITESAFAKNIEVAQGVIDDLRQAGVRIALDDFGTGYATLTQLLSFRLDKIKIDRSFVARLATSEDSLVIVRAILGLAKGFGLTTTAEGIENAAQRACLEDMGCVQGQGYLFGKAVPAQEVAALLALAPPAALRPDEPKVSVGSQRVGTGFSPR